MGYDEFGYPKKVLAQQVPPAGEEIREGDIGVLTESIKGWYGVKPLEPPGEKGYGTATMIPAGTRVRVVGIRKGMVKRLRPFGEFEEIFGYIFSVSPEFMNKLIEEERKKGRMVVYNEFDTDEAARFKKIFKRD